MHEPIPDDVAREWITFQETIETFPRHAGFVGAAVEPLPPEPANFVTESGQRLEVARQSIVVVVPA
jgi:hypothetical protein